MKFLTFGDLLFMARGLKRLEYDKFFRAVVLTSMLSANELIKFRNKEV